MNDFNIDERLNPNQREAVYHTEGPLLILAGAGSGKTRVIVHRIARLVEEVNVPPWNILAITFTNKAANEMRKRSHELLGSRAEKLWLGTFHSICNRILRSNPWKEDFLKGFVIYDQSDSAALIKKCLKELDINAERFSATDIRAGISRLKNNLLSPDKLNPPDSLQDEILSTVYSLYQRRLREARALDFGDLLMEAARMLQSDRTILESYQDRYRYIMVDEYQDTNYAQFKLVQLLGAKHGNVCVVGDDDQSIYSWRGANISNILNFEKHYPAARVIKLEENYRSTGTILEAAGSVVSKNEGRKDKNLWTRRHRGEPIRHFIAEDEKSEADYLRRMIEKLAASEGRGYRDMAVFYRVNAQSRVIEDFLRAGRIPYQVIGDIQFYQRKEIKDLIAYLKVIANPDDSVSLRRIINLPPRGIGGKTVGWIEGLCSREGLTLYRGIEEALKSPELGRAKEGRLGEFMTMLRGMIGAAPDLSVADLLTNIVQAVGYRKYLEKIEPHKAADRMGNVDEFVSSALQFGETHPRPTLHNFLDQLSLVSDQDNYDERLGAVALMTLHSSKGLEFPVVFMVGVEDGLCPHSRSADSFKGMEEERRLFYVGMTRAQEKLFFLSARSRTLHGISRHNPPSPFIRDIPRELIEAISEKSRRGREMRPGRAPSPAGHTFQERGPEQGPFKRGAVVMHPKFGKGIVFRQEGEGEGLKLIIDFINFGQKKLLARFANLEEL